MMDSISKSSLRNFVSSRLFFIQLYKFCEYVLINLWLGHLFLHPGAHAFNGRVEVFVTENFNFKKGGYAEYYFQVS